MKFAYNAEWLNNLHIVKEAKQWLVSGLITKEQYTTIAEQHPSKFYHPNLIIRILLLVATLIVLGAITGLLVLMFIKAEEALSFLSVIYGVGSMIVLDRVFIASKNHYKSGITEAILYHSVLFIILGFVEIFEESPAPYAIVLTCLLAFTAYRYLDLISTIGSLCAFAWLVFYWLYQAGGATQQVIPIVFIVLFTPLYFGFKRLKKIPTNEP